MSAFTAVVTGATGFVALEVVKQLLEKGYNVRATVRSAADHSKTATLQALGSAFPGKLELFEADLLSPGSFDGAISGADYVFHVASPFRIDVEDPQRDLIDPAVQGTRNVLASVVKNKNTVRRTVITSSVAAVHGGKSKVPPTNGALYTEEDFNKSSTVDNGEAYWASKSQAEEAAWQVAKQEGLDIVTILPNFVLGPVLSSRIDGLSAQFVKGWLEGKGSSGDLTICDVRDVARAHIAAVETPTAAGRYIISDSHCISSKFVSETFKARFPELTFPPGEDLPHEERIDNSKAKRELNIYPIAPQVTLIDMAVTLLQLGVVQPTHTGD